MTLLEISTPTITSTVTPANTASVTSADFHEQDITMNAATITSRSVPSSPENLTVRDRPARRRHGHRWLVAPTATAR